MAIDIVRPIKIEIDQDFSYSETDPTEDYISAKGLVIEDNENVRIDKDVSDNMTFRDVVSGGPHTLADLLETTSGHRTLNELVHWLAEDCYLEVTYNATYGWRMDSKVWWTDSGKTTKIREVNYTYDGSIIWRVNSLVVEQMDGAGSVVETLSGTFNYHGTNVWKLLNATWSLT